MAKRKNSWVKRNCFVCGEPLMGSMSGALDQRFDEGPEGGVTFASAGDYGSEVLDMGFNVGSVYVEICVCDKCLLERKERTFTYLEHNSKQTMFLYHGLPHSGADDVKKTMQLEERSPV
jgi:hypothetical protein